MSRKLTVAGGAWWVATLRWLAIAAAFVNLAIHLALTPDHLSEELYIGVLFVIVSGLLGMVVIGLASDHDRLRALAWIGGTAICAIQFIGFVVSRTGGLPLGYREAWTGAPEDLLGLASLFLELAFIGCAAGSVRRGPRTSAPPVRRSWLPLHDRTAPLP